MVGLLRHPPPSTLLLPEAEVEVAGTPTLVEAEVEVEVVAATAALEEEGAMWEATVVSDFRPL